MAETAEVIIIGSGVVGCSVAYHLAKLGCGNVIVLDKGTLLSRKTSSGICFRRGNTRIRAISAEVLEAGFGKE